MPPVTPLTPSGTATHLSIASRNSACSAIDHGQRCLDTRYGLRVLAGGSLPSFSPLIRACRLESARAASLPRACCSLLLDAAAVCGARQTGATKAQRSEV